MHYSNETLTLAKAHNVVDAAAAADLALFLGQYAHPLFHVGVKNYDTTGSKPVPLTVAEMTAHRRGILGRLNGSSAYRPTKGNFENGFIKAVKNDKDTSPTFFQDVCIEADKWISGEHVTRDEMLPTGKGMVANQQALMQLGLFYAENGAPGFLTSAVYSGGKSVHMHHVVQPHHDEGMHKLLSAWISFVSSVFLHSVGLSADTAAARPTQLSRMPVGNVYGRNQYMVMFDRETAKAKSHPTIHQVLSALLPVSFPGDTRTESELAAVADMVGSEIASHSEALSASMRPGVSHGWQDALRTLAKVSKKSYEFVAKTLTCVDDAFKKQAVRAGKTAGPRSTGGTKKKAVERTARLAASTTAAQGTFHPTLGMTFLNDPLAYDLMSFKMKATKQADAWIGDDGMTVEEFGTRAAYHAIMHGQPSRYSLSRFSKDGMDDQNPSAHVRWDSARQCYVYFNSAEYSTATIAPTIGRSVWSVTGHGEPVPFDNKWRPTRGGMDFLQLRPGAGKTTTLVHDLKARMMANKEFRAIWIAPNVSLVTKVCADLRAQGIKTMSYQEREAIDRFAVNGEITISDNSVLVVTMHSLHKVTSGRGIGYSSASCRPIDMIVFDEFGTGVAMMEKTDSRELWRTGEQGARKSYAKLLSLVKEATFSVFMEATPSAGCVAAITALGQSAGKKVTCFDITGKAGLAGLTRRFEPRSIVNIREQVGGYADVVSAANILKLEGKRVLVQLPNVKKARGLYETIRRNLKCGKVLLVTADTTDEPDVRAIMEGDGAAARDYRVVISTTSLAAGVSFVDVFDVNYVFFGAHIPPTTMAQAICRDRTCPRIVLVKMPDRTGKSSPVGTTDLNVGEDTEECAGFGAWRKAAIVDGKSARMGWHILNQWMRAEGFNVVTGEEALADVMKTCNFAHSDSSDGVVREIDASRKKLLDRNAEVIRIMRANGNYMMTASGFGESEGLNVGHAVVGRLHTVLSGLPGYKHIDVGAVIYGMRDRVFRHIQQSKDHSILWDAEDGWRAAARLICFGGEPSNQIEKRWLASIKLLEKITGLNVYDIMGAIPPALAQTALDGNVLSFLDTRYSTDAIVAKYSRTREQEMLKLLSQAKAEYNKNIPEMAELNELVNATGIRNPTKDNIVGLLFEKVLGAPVKIRRPAKHGESLLVMEQVSMVLAASIIVSSMLHTRTGEIRFMDDTLFEHAKGKSAVMPMPESCQGDNMLLVEVTPTWKLTIEAAQKSLRQWAERTKHPVIERNGMQTWASATPKALGVHRYQQRAKEGITMLNPADGNSQPLLHPSHSPEVEVTIPELQPRLNCYVMKTHEWVPMRSPTLAKHMELEQQVRKLTGNPKRNRHSKHMTKPPTDLWATAPPLPAD